MQETVKCSFCGTENPVGQEACVQCGTPLVVEAPQEPKIKCPNCGAQNIAGQQFCGVCGARLVAVAQEVLTAPTKGAPPAPVQQAPSPAPPKEAPPAPVQQAPPATPKEAPPAPPVEAPSAPAQQAPAKVVNLAALSQKVEVKPTWGLAWGLFWRILVLFLLFGGIGYMIYVVIMVLAFNASFPGGA
jgi:predicted RNA-binding Zn-ribbon protein involved in translation (DUF1610 family)